MCKNGATNLRCVWNKVHQTQKTQECEMNKTETARRPRKSQKWSVDVRESSGVGAASTEKTII